MNRSACQAILCTIAALVAGPAPAQRYEPPRHGPPPPLIQLLGPQQVTLLADEGFAIEHRRDPLDALAEHRRLATALAALQPRRAGQVNAYVVSVALDSDPVFGREAREAARLLERRYGAQGRSIVLAGSDGSAPSAQPRGAPASLDAALARVAELMDREQDVLILYLTAHGGPMGVVYNDAAEGYGFVSPVRLALVLDGLGIRRRVLIVSACYSGVFVPALANEDSAILTAASSDRTSFGCAADNDWTFFGDALINHALRKPQPLANAAREAAGLIAGWEAEGRLDASRPQTSIGSRAATWLAALDARSPNDLGTPVGKPARDLLAGR